MSIASRFIRRDDRPSSLRKWRRAINSYYNGTGKAVAVVIGDSVTEGFYAASGVGGNPANLRDSDMWISRASNVIVSKKSGQSRGGRYMPSRPGAAGLLGSIWPEAADPWTRVGTHGSLQNRYGLGLRTNQSGAGDYIEIAAPSWATHASIYFNGNGATGNGLTVLSNGVVVHSETMSSGDTSQKMARVVLQGSGNTLRIRTDGSLTLTFVHGVVWERNSLPAGTIVQGGSATGSGLFGAATTVSLTSAAVGDEMIILVGVTNGTAPATPAGWTQRAAVTVGSVAYKVITRVKQSGDTTVTVTGGGGIANTQAAMASFVGATFGSITTEVSGTAASTTIDPPSMTMTYADASVVLVGTVTNAGSVTYPTGWSARVTNGSPFLVGIGSKLQKIAAGTVDPGVITYGASSSDRITWQINLNRTNDDQNPVNYFELIDSAHGGYGVWTFMNPSASPTPPQLSQDVDYTMFDSINLSEPDLVIIMLGPNDAAAARTKATFKTALQSMVAKIDEKVSGTPDIAFVMYAYLDWTYGISIGSAPGATAYTAADWAAYEDAVKEVSRDLGSRSGYLLLSNYQGPLDGTDPGFTSNDGIHPEKGGHNSIGDIIGNWLC